MYLAKTRPDFAHFPKVTDGSFKFGVLAFGLFEPSPHLSVGTKPLDLIT
jgi:hypothetical protein